MVRKIGVLDLQGDVREHARAIQSCGHEAFSVKTPEDLNKIDGLIIPGGESTTIGKLLKWCGLLEEIVSAHQTVNLPIFGTCAGMILLAKDIDESEQLRLGLMDITVRRNAYGRQKDSFEADVEIPLLSQHPLRAVFIRAPYVTCTGENVEALARYQDKIVLVRQDNLLAGAFHPELTSDLRLHRYFIEKIVNNQGEYHERTNRRSPAVPAA